MLAFPEAADPEAGDDKKPLNQLLLALLERPREPVFVKKGSHNISFNVPIKDAEYTDKAIIQQRFGEEPLQVSSASVGFSPAIQTLFQFGRNERFSLFLEKHRQYASVLIGAFLNARSASSMVDFAATVRDRVNPELFSYALTVAVLHRRDTVGVKLPSLHEMFPDKFVDGQTITKAREVFMLVNPENRKPIQVEMNFAQYEGDGEQQLAYFREDVGVNLHHWHWHLVYPNEVDADDKELQLRIVNKDRRGELFYYMHQQLLARYDFERFSNKMPRVERLMDLHQAFADEYFPKLGASTSGRVWASRHTGSRLSNLRRMNESLELDIADLERWRDRILEAISRNQYEKFDVTANKLPLYIPPSPKDIDTDAGIDVLGNIVESSSLSPNRQLYGDLHNKGHMAIAFAHDPEGRFGVDPTVMGDTGTAMRDPIFYRWHALVNHLFVAYKSSLPPYREQDLAVGAELELVSVKVTSQGHDEDNALHTHWTKHEVDLARGLDFSILYGDQGAVLASITHLDHHPFTYYIDVSNKSKAAAKVTVRIFLGPKTDHRGHVLPFYDQRRFFFEMDRFVQVLKPGMNKIVRESIDSNLTIPYEQSFRELEKGNVKPDEQQSQFCGCGWPHHMLVPRGTHAGLTAQLFVMITEHEKDKVKVNATEIANKCDSGAEIFCGLRGQKYPDRRPMGFPFDRRAKAGVTLLSDFVAARPNMKALDIVIKHMDKVFAQTA